MGFEFPRIGPAGMGVAVLTLLAFGGGIFLAMLPFGSHWGGADGSKILPPGSPYERPEYPAVVSSTRPGPGAEEAIQQRREALSSAMAPGPGATRSVWDSDIQVVDEGEAAWALRDGITDDNFVRMAEFAAPTFAAYGTSAAETSQSGYDAVELPMVPEPATGVVIAVGMMLFLGLHHLRQRRQRHGAAVRSSIRSS